MLAKNITRLWAAATVCILITTSAGFAKLPGAEFLNDIVANDGAMLPKQKDQLQKYIQHLTALVAESNDVTEILAARAALGQAFRIIDTVSYQETYIDLVWSAAKDAFPRLKGDLQAVREMNLALALSGMSRPVIQTALEYLIVHPNPAVRYYGWVGYLDIRDMILSFREFGEKMYASLRARSLAETSGPVVGMILLTCRMPPNRPTVISEAAFKQFQETTFAIVSGCWAQRCLEVARGDLNMPEACIKGLAALENTKAVFENDAERKTAIYQMIADAMHCSARAYEGAVAAILEARRGGGEDPEAIQRRDANAQLLRECERVAVTTANIQKNFIAQTLGQAPMEKGALGMAVVQWIEALEAVGVKDPTGKFVVAPTTAPATSSAPAASSAPAPR